MSLLFNPSLTWAAAAMGRYPFFQRKPSLIEIPRFIEKYGQLTAEQLSNGQHNHSIVGNNSFSLWIEMII